MVAFRQPSSRTTQPRRWTGIRRVCGWPPNCTPGSRKMASATAPPRRSAPGAPMRTQSSPCARVPGSEKVKPLTYRLPDDSIPVLVSADTPDLLHDEAAALLSYATDHPEVAPQQLADMLFRTRIARRYRALAMVADRDDLLGALRAVLEGREHTALVRTETAATARKLAYVFPGQGVQRPGMGRLYYEAVPAFRAEADRCAEAFTSRLGESPLDYLLDEHLSAKDNAGIVQPALFTQ